VSRSWRQRPRHRSSWPRSQVPWCRDRRRCGQGGVEFGVGDVLQVATDGPTHSRRPAFLGIAVVSRQVLVDQLLQERLPQRGEACCSTRISPRFGCSRTQACIAAIRASRARSPSAPPGCRRAIAVGRSWAHPLLTNLLHLPSGLPLTSRAGNEAGTPWDRSRSKARCLPILPCLVSSRGHSGSSETAGDLRLLHKQSVLRDPPRSAASILGWPAEWK